MEDDSDYITSPDGSFTCGFYGAGENANWFSIWFKDSKERTVIWMANRDQGSKNRPSPVRFGQFVTDSGLLASIPTPDMRQWVDRLKLGGLDRVREMTRSTR